MEIDQEFRNDLMEQDDKNEDQLQERLEIDKLIKIIKRLKQSDYIYDKLMKDRNENLVKLIDDQEHSKNEISFVKKTGNQIKDKLSIKLQSISDDLEYTNEELDTIINILNQMKDANAMMS